MREDGKKKEASAIRLFLQKRKNAILLGITLGFLLAFCRFASLVVDRSPGPDETARWVLEEPEMWFSHKESLGHRGELIVNGEVVPIEAAFLHNGRMLIYRCEPESIMLDSRNILFTGDCKFGWNRYSDFTVKVDDDNVDMFEGKHPTLHFICQRQQKDGSWK